MKLAEILTQLDHDVKTTLEIQGVSDESRIAEIQLLFRIEAIAKGVVTFLSEMDGQHWKEHIYRHIAEQAEYTSKVLDTELTTSLAALFGIGGKDDNI